MFVLHINTSGVPAREVAITQHYTCCKCTDAFPHVQTTTVGVCQGWSTVTTCRQYDATGTADTCNARCYSHFFHSLRVCFLFECLSFTLLMQARTQYYL